MDPFNTSSTSAMRQDEVKTTSNTLVYTLSTVIVVLLGYIGYVYYAHDMLKKGDLNKKYVKKGNFSFKDLPLYVQSDYVKKYDYTQKVDQLNNEISQLEQQKQYGSKDVVNIDEKIEDIAGVEKVVAEPVVVKEKPKVVVEKIVKKVDKKALIASGKYSAFKCYDMIDGGFYASKQCINDLNNFLDKNQDASMFEVIGVINTREFGLIKKLKDVYGDSEVSRLSEFAQIGLSRKRVVEGTWAIKNHLGVDTNVEVVNYTITSKKGNKGFVVRAYK